MANENRTLSQAGREYIKRAEDRGGIPVLKAWKDKAGPWTGPWGITHGVQPGQVFTMAQAIQLFEAEIRDVETGLRHWLTVEVTQGLWDALVSFGYNNGWGKCGTLQNAVNSGDETKVRAAWMLFVHAFNSDTGRVQVWPGLVHRRQAELALWYREDHDPVTVAAPNPQTSAPLPPKGTIAQGPPQPGAIATALGSRTVWSQISSLLGVAMVWFGHAVNSGVQQLVGTGDAITNAVPDVQTTIDTGQQVAGWFNLNSQDVGILIVCCSIAFTIVRKTLDKKEQVL